MKSILLIFVSILFINTFACSFDTSGLGRDLSDSGMNDADVFDSGTDTSDSIDINDSSTDTDSETDGGTECTVGERNCIDNFTLRVCNENGEWDTQNCAEGCNSDASPASCLVFIPSNGLTRDVLSIPGTGHWEISETVYFNTENGEIYTESGTIRPAGEGVDLESGILFFSHSMMDGRNAGVFAALTITVEDTGILRGVGSQPAILASETIIINGIIDVSGGSWACSYNNERCPGPGGFGGGDTNHDGEGPGKGTEGFESWDKDETGAGGAGYGVKGAKGGGSSGGAGGSTYGESENEPLIGGSGGGGGGHYEIGNDNPGEGRGGGGGGAIQITAFAMLNIGNSIGTPAGIKASGQGGSGNSRYVNSGGGGGGSGGAIIIEAPFIQLYPGSLITANGGGGGAGRSGADGAVGLFSAEAAPGATCSDCNTGGNGAALNSPSPTDGSNSEGGDGTGGGGGGYGRITIRNCIEFISVCTVSPAPFLAGCHY